MTRSTRRRPPRIVAIGLNPTIDRTIHLPELAAGRVVRATAVVASAGGKALNVCRAARTLGATAVHVGPVPGDLGRVSYDTVTADEGIEVVAVPVEGEIRVSSIYLETGTSSAPGSSGRATVVNEPGPPLGAAGFAAVADAVAAAVAAAPGWVAVSGSTPPDTPPTAHAELIDVVHRSAGRVAIDVGGDRLVAAASAGADLVSPNLAEAEHALGASAALDDVVDDDGLDHGPAGAGATRDEIATRARAAAAELVARGAGAALVSAGRHGLAVAADGTDEFVAAPRVAVANPIGAGDALLGATLVALQSGLPLTAAARIGVAYAAASVAHPVAGYASPADAEPIAAEIAAATARTAAEARPVAPARERGTRISATVRPAGEGSASPPRIRTEPDAVPKTHRQQDGAR